MAKKIAILVALSLCTIASAMAEVAPPALNDVHMAPSQTPRVAHGFADLSAREGSRKEKLPMQLEGAIKKVKKAKYKPQHVGREAKTINF
ncbi:MAG TPA: hypothetical protein VIH99_02165 [Bdellovibrionota bacterium]|jgi:hypothetical protein